MKKYPIGIQDFEELRRGDYLYIDKTEAMFRLQDSGKYFFLSRPRRFGKSLLLSTLKYFFLGRKELFEGLWVGEQIEHDWEAHPVLHWSFSSSGYQDIGLEAALMRLIEQSAEAYRVQLTSEGLSGRFRELLQKLGSGPRKVVLLIDEYDKPLVDYIEDVPKADANRSVLKNFFSILKDSDPYLRMLLITGVSKFSKVSLFSDLNNLEDLTINPYAATITGYTQAELEASFSEEIELMAQEMEVSQVEMLTEIQTWYNGYKWWGPETLYNPFSILNLMKTRTFRNYWWESGTPSFLIKQLRKEFQFDLRIVEAGHDTFESYTLENLEWRSLMFQTGYLTIQHYDRSLRLFTLGYPNLEVQDAMYRHLFGAFRESDIGSSQVLYANIKRSLDANDLPRLMELIDTLFSTIPHQIFIEKQEAFFHAVLHLTFQGLGLLTQSEVSTSKGRVDSVLHAKHHIYVMEFKLDDSAQSALDQIRSKRYGSAYLGTDKPVIAIGIGFSSETRTVANWEAMAYEELLAEG